jgi:hypothetical protein
MPVVRQLTLKDIEDTRLRIRLQRIRIQSLQGLGKGTDIAEAELRSLTDALGHLEFHQRVFEFSLSHAGGVSYGFIPKL